MKKSWLTITSLLLSLLSLLIAISVLTLVNNRNLAYAPRVFNKDEMFEVNYTPLKKWEAVDLIEVTGGQELIYKVDKEKDDTTCDDVSLAYWEKNSYYNVINDYDKKIEELSSRFHNPSAKKKELDKIIAEKEEALEKASERISYDKKIEEGKYILEAKDFPMKDGIVKIVVYYSTK